jgi:integral membrane sensor domain MASE1
MIQSLRINILREKPLLIYAIKVLLLAVIYHLAARFGLKMTYMQASSSPVWPPTGIGLATLLIFGYRIWLGISLEKVKTSNTFSSAVGGLALKTGAAAKRDFP